MIHNSVSRQRTPPLFSLVIPLHDDRGVALQAFDAWLSQRADATPFELIVVDSGKRSLARKVAQRLGPDDKMVSAKSSNEAQLYNLGARAAISDWIVFTEAHVVPGPEAVALLCRRLKSTSCDAASFGSTHRMRSHLAHVDAALFERESDAMRTLGLWRTVGLRGLVIRRDLFQSLGTFDEEYLRFAETVLAIRIVEGGHKLEEFSDVVMEHFDTDSVQELLNAMSAGRLGEHRFWASKPELACDYFQSNGPSPSCDSIEPGMAQLLWYQILHAIIRGNHQAAYRLQRLSRSTLFAAITGRHGETCKTMIRIYSTYLRLWSRLYLTRNEIKDYEPFLDQYLSLRECCAKVGSIRFRGETSRNLGKTRCASPQVIEAKTLREVGINFFPTEIWQGENYCWSSPIAAMRLSLDSSDYRLYLDARPTGGWLVRIPNLYINGVKIPKENISESGGIIQVLIRSDKTRGSCDAIFSWDCVPFIPADSGLPDKRQLGVALIRMHIEKVVSTTRQNESGCAA